MTESLATIDPLIALAVFVIIIVIDALHVLYTKAVAEDLPARAANFGALIYLGSAFSVLSYTENPAYLIFVVVGSWIGVYLTVRFHPKKKLSPPSTSE